MPGEQGQEGSAHVELFADLVAKLGWQQHGDLNRNVPCQKCPPKKGGDPNEHGVDGLFVIQCALAGRERAIIVDGKRYAQASIGGPKKLGKMLGDLVHACSHLRESPDYLERARSVSPGIRLDTAILAWFCHDGWNPAEALRWRADLGAGRSPVHPPVYGFVSTNIELDRLAAIANFKDKLETLEFMYVSSTHGGPVFSSVLSPELLHSTMFFSRYKVRGSTAYKYAAFYFDADSGSEGVSFLLNYLAYYGQFSHESIEVLAPVSRNAANLLEAELRTRTRGGDGSLSLPAFRVVELAAAPYRA